jgi:hypothetical protein
MKNYRADIGSWERGRTFNYTALNNKDALNKAVKERQSNPRVYGDDAFVVQIMGPRGYVYDFMSGLMSEES